MVMTPRHRGGDTGFTNAPVVGGAHRRGSVRSNCRRVMSAVIMVVHAGYHRVAPLRALRGRVVWGEDGHWTVQRRHHLVESFTR
jgi:hypothetical protein